MAKIQRFECMGGIMEPTVVDERIRGTWVRYPDYEKAVKEARADERARVEEREREEIAQALEARADIIATDPLNAGETPEARLLREVASYVRGRDGFPEDLQAAVEKAARLPNRTPVTFAALNSEADHG